MTSIRLSSGKTFETVEGETLLDGALRADVVLAYSCRTGRCGTCKGKLLSGATKSVHAESGLSETERAAGWILTCAREATSDVEVDVEDLGALNLIHARMMPARIQGLELLATDILKVTLRLPPGSLLDFFPGQYVDVIGQGGLRRSYSIANAPAADNLLQLHIRRVVGGAMSGYWFDAAKVNDLLRLHGPLGTFFLRRDDVRDLIFLATGTGIAPIKAMLEGLQAQPKAALQPRTVSVYWGGRLEQDIYWQPTTVGVQLQFTPVLSRAGPSWQGARGYVQHALLARQSHLEHSAVYACGSEAMIREAREILAVHGMHERRFFADAFVCSS